MGLEDFKSTDDDSQESEEDVQQDEETSSDDEPSGLESFRTDSTRGGSGSESDSDDEEKSLHGLPPRKWKQMSKDERVRYMRNNRIPDYHPSYQPDDRWDYARCVEISCVCGNNFVFLTAGICLECGRGYKDAGRTVIKRHDPHQEQEQNDEQ